MTNLLYLAKPTVGGWVSFTAHLSLLRDTPIYKISKRTETKGGSPKYRDFGYNTKYQNVALDDFLALEKPILVTAVDKTGHDALEQLPDGTDVVIHDPTEIKANKGKLLTLLPRFNVITIRQTVSNLLDELGIPNTFLHHPYVAVGSSFPTKQKAGAVSVSRIDYDKHTEVILKANQLMLDPIDIYGTKNDRYVYHKLRDLDPMKEQAPGSSYRGKFPKDFHSLADILVPAKYVVDLSKIKQDGGGSQYTFLEAIDFGCALILNKDWIEGKDTPFVHGKNCFAVGNEYELADLLNSDPDTTKITKNAKLLLEPHVQAGGW